MNLEKFNFRWSDIDANMHIKNTAYNDLFIQHRLSLLVKMGFGMPEFKKIGMGPMIIHEHLYYLKEVRADSEVYIDMYLKGNSEDWKYMQFAQHLYNNKGELSCFLDLTLSLLDIRERKLALPPAEMIKGLKQLKKTDDYKIIDSSALKVDGVPYGFKITPSLLR